jgi:uncharacterized membrane protein YbhN (UPF0104 family)
VNNFATPSRRLFIWTLRIAALALVGWFVSGSVRGAVAELSQHEWHVNPLWLLAAGAIYALALVPMGWFWQRTLAALGCPMPFIFALFAYFMGHIGKYVPGKAMSVILRVAAVRKWVPSMRIALISTLLETLTMMAVGACLAAAMSVFVLRLDWMYSVAAVVFALATALPTLPPIARRLAMFGLNRSGQANGASNTAVKRAPTPAEIATRLREIDFGLLAQGWFAAAIGWLLQAVSLWATLRSIGIDRVSLVGDLPTFVAAVSFAVVAGFASQIPAGLGVRDALLMQLLVPACGQTNSFIAAVLMRLIWLMSELAACGILYIGARFAGSNGNR